MVELFASGVGSPWFKSQVMSTILLLQLRFLNLLGDGNLLVGFFQDILTDRVGLVVQLFASGVGGPWFKSQVYNFVVKTKISKFVGGRKFISRNFQGYFNRPSWSSGRTVCLWSLRSLVQIPVPKPNIGFGFLLHVGGGISRPRARERAGSSGPPARGRPSAPPRTSPTPGIVADPP